MINSSVMYKLFCYCSIVLFFYLVFLSNFNMGIYLVLYFVEIGAHVYFPLKFAAQPIFNNTQFVIFGDFHDHGSTQFGESLESPFYHLFSRFFIRGFLIQPSAQTLQLLIKSIQLKGTKELSFFAYKGYYLLKRNCID